MTTSTTSGTETAATANYLGTSNVVYTLTGLLPNTTYYFQFVAVNNVITSSFPANFTTEMVQLAPSVTNLPATNVTVTSSTLNAVVNPNDGSTSYYFNYGLTSSYGSATPQINGLTSIGTVTSLIQGLNTNTTYHYQIVASNSGGISKGGDSTFTTGGVPIVSTTNASSVTASNAQLNGTINPNSGVSSVAFIYGTTTNYGSITPAQNGITSFQSVTSLLSNLAPATLYHFAIKGSNSAGLSFGVDKTFTTSNSPTGSVHVTLSPSAVVNGGAMWQLDNGSLEMSGFTQSPVSPGTHTLGFSSISGWTSPTNTSVTVTTGQTTNIVCQYQLGPTLLSLVGGYPSTFTVETKGPAGTTNLLQRSTNLIDWLVIATNVLPNNGVFDFMDTNNIGATEMFYRNLSK